MSAPLPRLVAATDAESFFNRMRLNGECWEFTGNVHQSTGYGRVYVGHGEYVHTHRHAYSFAKGAIPAGLCVCHTCDNRLCINPAHLFLGTKSENAADMDAKGRRGRRPAPAPLTHCRRHGVELTEENTVKAGRQKRKCKLCSREACRRWESAHGRAYRKASRAGEDAA